MIYEGLTMQSCCCGTEYELEAHGAEAPPPSHDYKRQCETQQASGLSFPCFSQAILLLLAQGMHCLMSLTVFSQPPPYFE